jgi:3-deoxy-D-manno-octulosonic-acid transferase
VDRVYLIVSELISPLVLPWLFWRRLKGKEDAARFSERFGYTSHLRPKGKLLWLHAASVGEATSILPLIGALRARHSEMHVLVTTGTKTSALLMKERLPQGVIHQYAPVDTPAATWRFTKHWRPEFAFFVESEFWPNLVFAANAWQCFLGVINGRMSQRSFRFWNNYPVLMQKMLACFDIAFAQSEDDKKRLETLGAKNTLTVGNLKYDAEPLPCDETKLLQLKTALGARPVWLAASTHPGEEIFIAEAQTKLAALHPGLLAIIVPRHPVRGAEIAAMLQKKFPIGLRSRGDAIQPEMEMYIADTLGELGLFYRLSDIVFMGGSLVPHGGQNPLEPARLAASIVTGPHTHNFADIYRDLENAKACLRARNAEELATKISGLFSNPGAAQTMQDAAKAWVESQRGATERVLAKLSPVFSA